MRYLKTILFKSCYKNHRVAKRLKESLRLEASSARLNFGSILNLALKLGLNLDLKLVLTWLDLTSDKGRDYCDR